MRALPNWFKGDSVYAMFPFTVPDEQRLILRDLGQEDDYDYNPPKLLPDPIQIATHAACLKVLADPQRFKVPCE